MGALPTEWYDQTYSLNILTIVFKIDCRDKGRNKTNNDIDEKYKADITRKLRNDQTVEEFSSIPIVFLWTNQIDVAGMVGRMKWFIVSVAK